MEDYKLKTLWNRIDFPKPLGAFTNYVRSHNPDEADKYKSTLLQSLTQTRNLAEIHSKQLRKKLNFTKLTAHQNNRQANKARNNSSNK